MDRLDTSPDPRSDIQALLGTPAEPEFDRITRLVQRHFGFDVALFALIDGERIWYKSRQGLTISGRDRRFSMCHHALQRDDVFTFSQPDAPPDEDDTDALVWRSDKKFYVGRSIRAPSGEKIGTLCMMHSEEHAVSPIDLSDFDDFATLLEGALENRAVSAALASLTSELDVAKREALLDPLAGVWNRRGLEVMGRKIADEAASAARPLAAAMIDIDHFKAVNDMHGHAAGDAAIMRLAAVLRGVARRDDCVARYGGEEFVLLAPSLSHAELPRWGERIRNAIAAEMAAPRFTVSIGLAAHEGDRHDVGALLSAADDALYAAKAAGRDRYEVAAALKS